MFNDDDNILSEVKKMLDIEPDTEEFDLDIISLINSAFFTLFQLGIGPSEEPFTIDSNTTWVEFNTIVPKSIIAEYLYLKSKVVFDAPSSSYMVDAIKDRTSELEFRMNVYTDNGGGVIIG